MFSKTFIVAALIVFCSCSTFKNVDIKGAKELPKFFTARWIKNLDPGHDTGNLPIALQSPLIYRGFVYVGDNSGHMNAYSLEDGRLIWRFAEQDGYHSMPVAYKNSIIYGNANGRLYSRDYRSGKLNYAVDVGASVESQPTIYKGRLFLHSRNHQVFALDVETGKILWAYKRSVPFLTTLQRVSRPFVYSNRVYVGFADGFVASFSTEEGVLLWETKVAEGNKFIDVDSAPIVFSGKLVVTSMSDSLAVVNIKNGLIERKIPYSVSRAPFTHKEHLIAGTADGELIRLDKDFKVVLKKKIAKDSVSNIRYFKNRLIISTVDGYLISVDDQNFDVEEQRFLGHKSSAIFGDLAIEDDSMAAMSSRNRLYVF